MEFIIKIGETKSICIVAKQTFSENYIKVAEGEKYSFRVEEKQKWKDWKRASNANGFWNPLLPFGRFRRVENAKCFQLCGTIGHNESGHFPIGLNLEEYEIKKSGNLYFFPNDSKNLKRYNNNEGSITLKIRRIV